MQKLFDILKGILITATIAAATGLFLLAVNVLRALAG